MKFTGDRTGRPLTPLSIHANINKRCISLLPKGGKTEHRVNRAIALIDADFRVQKGGHKTIAEGAHRAVVARMHGLLWSDMGINGDPFAEAPEWVEITYNPKAHPERDYFYRRDTGERVGKVDAAWLITHEGLDTRTNTRAYVRLTSLTQREAV